MRYQKAAQSTIIVSFLTVVSSILGFFMQALTAKFFGASRVMDAYVAAQTIPDIFLKILQGGVLSIVFVPIFVKFLAKGQEKKAWQVTANLFNVITLVFGGVIFLGIIITPFLVELIVPGFDTATKKETIYLSRIFFPTMLLNMLSVLAVSVMNAYKKFSFPVFLRLITPTLLIFLLLIFQNTLGIQILAWGVLSASFLQYIILYGALLKKGLPLKFTCRFNDPVLKRIVVLVYPFVFATIISQLGSVVDKILASHLIEGSISALFFSNKVIRFASGTFLTAIPLVAFPTFSEYIAKRDWDNLRQGLSSVFRLTIFIILPATAGLIILRKPIIEFLFERGAFDAEDTILTSQALFFYAFGLFAVGITHTLGNLYYALEKTKILVKISIVVIISNIILNLLLVGPLKQGGLALATSLVQILSLILHFKLLLKWIPNLKQTLLDKYIAKIFAASLLMSFFTFLFWRVIARLDLPQNLLWQGSRLLLIVLSSVGIYSLISSILHIQEQRAIVTFFKKKVTMIFPFEF